MNQLTWRHRNQVEHGTLAIGVISRIYFQDVTGLHSTAQPQGQREGFSEKDGNKFNLNSTPIVLLKEKGMKGAGYWLADWGVLWSTET